jgi:hypothetical protein
MAAQIGTPYNRPMGPDQTECHEGPRIHFDRPRAGTPPLTSSDFRCGPATLWGECRACAMGSAELLNFGPSISAPR